MFRETVTYPLAGEDGIGAVLVAGGLLLLALLFVVVSPFLLLLPAFVGLGFLLIVRGYYVRVMRWTTRYPDADAPPFDDWSDLVLDGLRAGFISLLYLLPAFGLFVLAAIVSGFSSVPEPRAVVEALNTVTGLLVLAAGLYLLGVLYLLPAAVANFAYHDDVGAAFDLRVITDGAFTEDYAVGWVFTALYQVLAWPFILLLYLLLVGFFLRAHVGIGVRYVYGRSLRDGLDLEPVPRPTQGDDGATDHENAAGAQTSDSERVSGFVDIEDLVDVPDRQVGVHGPAAADAGEGAEEAPDGGGPREADERE